MRGCLWVSGETVDSWAVPQLQVQPRTLAGGTGGDNPCLGKRARQRNWGPAGLRGQYWAALQGCFGEQPQLQHHQRWGQKALWGGHLHRWIEEKVHQHLEGHHSPLKQEARGASRPEETLSLHELWDWTLPWTWNCSFPSTADNYCLIFKNYYCTVHSCTFIIGSKKFPAGFNRGLESMMILCYLVRGNDNK